MLAIIRQVFEEDEAAMPPGAEDQVLPKIPNKLQGASKKRRGKGAGRK
jgi:hypothetical protein